MSSLVATAILLLLVVILSVVCGVKAELSEQYSSNQHKKVDLLEKSIQSKDESASSHNYHYPKHSDIKSKQNNFIPPDKKQGTLLKTKYVREDNRLNPLDQESPRELYKQRYPTLKPRKHYYDKNEIDNSINVKTGKFYYPKDVQKQKQYYQQPVDVAPEHKGSSPQKVIPKPEATVQSTFKPEDDLIISNSSEQSDFDLLESSNGSVINESLSSNYSDFEKSRYSQCPACRIRDSDKQYRIEKLKQSILSSLHMTAPPNTSHVIPKVPALAHFYQMDEKMINDSPYTKRTDHSYDEDFTVKTERIFTKARQPPSQVQLNITDSLYLAPPIKLYTCKIRTAYLWFYIRKKTVRQPYIHLTIERILPESVPANRLITKTIFSQKLLRDKAFGWKRIDLRNVLRRWLAHPMSNHGLQIRALDDQGNNLVVLTPTADVDKGFEPWLDTKVLEQKSHSRHRRSQALRCTENSTESRCCRYPLYVTFAEFGWEWIIAPNQVRVDYCSGECRMTMQDNTPHSWISQQVQGSSRSCCSPTKLAALPLIYFDGHYNVLFQILQDMKVESCGCT